uniref:APC family permease n=1 Tax=Rhodococcus qingshengii TaxID=334542 RepID=UPI001C4DE9D4|nr:APC family permease [Rhodococcus qingshengii]
MSIISHTTDGYEHEPDPADAASNRKRLSGTVGAIALLFMVLAYNGPLSGVVGYLPVVIGYGNGLGAPLAYALAGLVLAGFAVGFMKMSSKIKNPGGFYSFITAGLGRDVGLGAAGVALFVYFAILVSSTAFMGLSMKNLVEVTLSGPSIHWSVYGLGTLIVIGVLGYFKLELSARVLGVLLVFELVIVAVYDIAVVVQGGATGLTASFLDPDVFLSGSVGLALLFAMSSFGGFEATVVFRHEIKDPNRTIPRATYGFLVVVGLFYAFSAWAITQALGDTDAVTETAADPTGSVFATFRTFLGVFGQDVMTVLLCTSIFAAILSMHNVLTRYVFNLAYDGVFSARIAQVHPTQKSPHKASVLVSTASIIAMAAFVLSGSAITVLYAQLAGIFGYGLLLLITVTDIAVIVYLHKNRQHSGNIWQRSIAPGVALIGLVVVLVLGTLNIDILLAVSKSTAITMCIGVYVLWILGMLYARRLKARSPKVYAQIGLQ